MPIYVFLRNKNLQELNKRELMIQETTKNHKPDIM